MEYTESFKNRNRKNRENSRNAEKILGEQYRNSGLTNMTFTEYKRQWKEAQKLKQMKIHYSAFEPLPNETIQEFKERLHGVNILIPSETVEEFNNRIGKLFSR